MWRMIVAKSFFQSRVILSEIFSERENNLDVPIGSDSHFVFNFSENYFHRFCRHPTFVTQTSLTFDANVVQTIVVYCNQNEHETRFIEK